ncbi:hypothetical protein GQ457_12G013570 [Hibiscus cannabinus]
MPLLDAKTQLPGYCSDIFGPDPFICPGHLGLHGFPCRYSLASHVFLTQGYYIRVWPAFLKHTLAFNPSFRTKPAFSASLFCAMDPELVSALENLQFTEEEATTVVAETSMEQEDSSSWLVGSVITQKPVNGDSVIRVFRSIWKAKNIQEIFELRANFFLVKPSYRDAFFSIKLYNPVWRIDEYDFRLMTIWIRIYRLPLRAMNRDMGLRLGGCVGKVLGVDHRVEGGNIGDFLRILVQVVSRKPLRRCVLLGDSTCKDASPKPLRYERLPEFCYLCGVVGHPLSDCTEKPASFDAKKLPYGNCAEVHLETPTEPPTAKVIANSSFSASEAVETIAETVVTTEKSLPARVASETVGKACQDIMADESALHKPAAVLQHPEGDKDTGCFTVDFGNGCNGLMLLWNNEINVNLLSYSATHIDAIVDSPTGSFRFTGFHRYYTESMKHLNWSLFDRLRQASPLPWLVGEDFSELLCHSEKEGGRRKCRGLIENFWECLHRNDLFDCKPSSGWCIFTYSNGSHGTIRERLDHFVASPDWRGGDYFRYDNCWGTESACIDKVHTVWSFTAGSAIDKLSAIGGALRNWQHNRRKSTTKRIGELQSSLGGSDPRPPPTAHPGGARWAPWRKRVSPTGSKWRAVGKFRINGIGGATGYERYRIPRAWSGEGQGNAWVVLPMTPLPSSLYRARFHWSGLCIARHVRALAMPSRWGEFVTPTRPTTRGFGHVDARSRWLCATRIDNVTPNTGRPCVATVLGVRQCHSQYWQSLHGNSIGGCE